MSLQTWDQINPYSESKIVSWPLDSDESWQTQLKALDQAFRVFRKLEREERMDAISKWGQAIQVERDNLAEMLTHEMGKPIQEARAEVDKCIESIRIWPEVARTWFEQISPKIDWQGPYKKTDVELSALGIVFGIMPWNYPYWQTLRLALPTLTVGNSLAIKPAASTARCLNGFLDLFPAVAQNTVVTALNIDHQQTAKVIADSRVQGVSFTGSESGGRKVAAIAGVHLKKTVLELGSSDAYIVFDDVDQMAAAELAYKARMVNGGQSCIAGKRFYVQKKCHDQFLACLAKVVGQSTVVGDPMDDKTNLGPMSGKAARDTLQKQFEGLLRAGARDVSTSIEKEFPMPEKGYFFLPKILDFKSLDDMPINEEVFGPIFCVCAFDSDEELAQHLSESDFGLGAGIFTHDEARQQRWLKKLEAGHVVVNDHLRSHVAIPFGGIKNSGYGRELSFLSLFEFASVKVTSMGKALDGKRAKSDGPVNEKRSTDRASSSTQNH